MATLLRVARTRGGNEPEHPVVKTNSFKSPIEGMFDVRDILSHTVANGYEGMNNPTVQNNFKLLASRIGLEAAQKLMTKAFLFNQSNRGGGQLERVQKFYDTPSGDDVEVNKYITGAKGLAYGPSEGYSTSRLFAIADDARPEDISFKPDKKVMLKVRK